MAHHSATLKAIRTTKTRTERSKARRSQVRTSIKKVDAAIIAGTKKEAVELLKDAQKNLFKAVSKGVVKKKTASRKVSRLNTQIKALA